MKIIRSIVIYISISASLSVLAAEKTVEALYQEHCVVCHGTDRLGGTGPALLPENLTRVTRQEAAEVIRSGRPSTQMAGFQNKIADTGINGLVEYIYQPPAQLPVWDQAEITASHIIHVPEGQLGDKPVFSADPLNLFLVVETGDHHITVLDGDRFEPIHRFPTRFALHGGPKYSSGGRFVYLASRDGWVSKFDLYNLKMVAEIRAGINTRNLAISSDNRYVMVGNYLPHTLVILNAGDLSLNKIIPVTDDHGHSSRVSAVYDVRPRKSFVAALKDLPEVWEIPYNDDHEPIYPGLVHDYRYQEAIPLPGPFPVRRIRLDDYLDDFFFDNQYQNIIGAARNGKNGQVVNLLVGRKIADVDLTGMPHLGSGITWEYQGREVLATPNLAEGEVTIIDMKDWSVIKRIKTLGPGYFMRSHENSKYAWVDVFSGPHKDAMHVLDKATLEIVKTLRPVLGKTSAHVEFTRDGKFALLSIWEMDGAIIVYNADTLEEVKRIPMKKPSGKYNVYNKITLSEGTSH
ncbi:MAG: cytochrome Cbb3 [Gammaproteobacteria bacterium]|nr:cytochrome Cbb3 [Gammaproteobacteria bacterium]